MGKPLAGLARSAVAACAMVWDFLAAAPPLLLDNPFAVPSRTSAVFGVTLSLLVFVGPLQQRLQWINWRWLRDSVAVVLARLSGSLSLGAFLVCPFFLRSVIFTVILDWFAVIGAAVATGVAFTWISCHWRYCFLLSAGGAVAATVGVGGANRGWLCGRRTNILLRRPGWLQRWRCMGIPVSAVATTAKKAAKICSGFTWPFRVVPDHCRPLLA